MEFKNIHLEELKEYTQNHNAVIIENCDIEGCESLDQMESILNTVHFFDDATEKKSMAGDLQIVDAHRITGTSKDGKDTLFTLKEGAKTSISKRLFTLMTGMQIHNTPDLFLIKEKGV
jgi:hypothetical protein